MSAWSDFKANPGLGTYLDWVRDSYSSYDAARVEQDLSVGGDVTVLAAEAVDLGEEAAREVLNAALDVGEVIVNATLDVVRGLGGAIIDGLDGAYDAARKKLNGREPDVVAGLVVATLSIMTAIYLYHSAKYARDAF